MFDDFLNSAGSGDGEESSSSPTKSSSSPSNKKVGSPVKTSFLPPPLSSSSSANASVAQNSAGQNNASPLAATNSSSSSSAKSPTKKPSLPPCGILVPPKNLEEEVVYLEKKFSIKVAVETVGGSGDDVIAKLTCHYPAFKLVLDVLRSHYDRFMAGEDELNTAAILGHDLDDFFSADLLGLSSPSTTTKRTTTPPGLIKAVIVGSCDVAQACRTRLTNLSIGTKDVRVADVVEIIHRACNL